MAMLDDHKIPYHEKPYEEKAGNENARGQMFCDDSAGDIIDMLKNGCAEHDVEFALKTKVTDTSKTNSRCRGFSAHRHMVSRCRATA